MAWFARFRRRLKNYTSDGDYAGSHGGGKMDDKKEEKKVDCSKKENEKAKECEKKK